MKKNMSALAAAGLAMILVAAPALSASAASRSLGLAQCAPTFRAAHWAGAKGNMTISQGWIVGSSSEGHSQGWNNGTTATTRTLLTPVGISFADGTVYYTSGLTADRGNNCRWF